MYKFHNLDQFTDYCARFVAEHHNPRCSRNGNGCLNIEGRTFELDNLWRLTRQQPERQTEIVAEYFTHIFNPRLSAINDLTLEKIKNSVLPKVYKTSVVEERKIPHEPFSGELSKGLCIDGELTMVPLTSMDLARWDTGFDDLYQIALRNLQRMDDSWPLVSFKKFEGIAFSRAVDGYAAARILLPDIYQRLRHVLGEKHREFLVFTPTRDSFIATSADNDERILQIVTTAQRRFENEAYPLSPWPILVKRDGLIHTREWTALPTAKKAKNITQLMNTRAWHKIGPSEKVK